MEMMKSVGEILETHKKTKRTNYVYIYTLSKQAMCWYIHVLLVEYLSEIGYPVWLALVQ